MNGGSENAMFDNEFGQDHMYHSSQCAAVAQGVEVTFINQITLADFLIHTRRDCCRHRYHNVCLYADGVKISCTPSSNYNPGDVINFMDFRISGKFPIIASSFKLQWDGPPDCVQINELFIYYTGTYPAFLGYSGLFLGILGLANVGNMTKFICLNNYFFRSYALHWDRHDQLN